MLKRYLLFLTAFGAFAAAALDGVLFPDRVAPDELEKVRDKLAELVHEGERKDFRR